MEKLEPSKCKKEDFIPTAERCEIQRHLIEQFCRIMEEADDENRNTCASNWIGEYADNFDDLDRELVSRYKKAEMKEEKSSILKEIQAELEILNERNG
jgi:hypothetical protein